MAATPLWVDREENNSSIWLQAVQLAMPFMKSAIPGHTVGLWHEQSREDRDAYVIIHWNKIRPGYEHNFSQRITDGDDIGAYDYQSVMHYPRTAFSTDGSDTITPVNPSASIGQRSSLSSGDIAAVNSLYPVYQCPPSPRIPWPPDLRWEEKFRGWPKAPIAKKSYYSDPAMRYEYAPVPPPVPTGHWVFVYDQPYYDFDNLYTEYPYYYNPYEYGYDFGYAYGYPDWSGYDGYEYPEPETPPPPMSGTEKTGGFDPKHSD